jgi:hypothetical protein
VAFNLPVLNIGSPSLAGGAVGAAGGGPLAQNATDTALRIGGELALTIYAALQGDPAEEPTWTLEAAPEDARYGLPTVFGYTRPESDQQSVGADILESGGFGARRRITIPRSAPANRVSITGLWPMPDTSAGADPLDALVRRAFMALKEPLYDRTRPPALVWTYGSRQMRCWLADLSIEVPHGLDAETGALRALRVSFTLVEATAAKLVQARSPFERETSWHTWAPGDTWEGLAQRLLADPMKGVLLRRINPQIVLPTPDARVRVFDATHSRLRVPVAPASPAWLQTGAMTRVAEKAKARLVGAVRAWEGLSATLTTVPEGEPTPLRAGATAGGRPAWRPPVERDRDRAAAIARGEVEA